MAYEDVEMFAVESSMLTHIGYDMDEMVLYVTFPNGTTAWYQGVDLGVWQGFLEAGSYGTYFWDYIRRAEYPFGYL